MSEGIYLMTLFTLFGTILLVFGMRYYSAVQQAKVLLANEDDYQQLVTKLAGQQADIAQSLASMEATLAELHGRVASVERILKDVE
ncbi:hypothetical protein [Chitinimonas sp.]|uniref:hypothetical protein n=1 Tax=Chitinimonas sp. TaxID=1934313 RepID=UPI002F943D99